MTTDDLLGDRGARLPNGSAPTMRCTCPHSSEWHRTAYRGPHDIGQQNGVVCDFPGCA